MPDRKKAPKPKPKPKVRAKNPVSIVPPPPPAPSAAGGGTRERRPGEPVAVRWVGFMRDGSGYAEAARNYVAALLGEGVQVTAKSISIDNIRGDYGLAGKLAEGVIDRPLNYHVNVIFVPPHFFRHHMDPNCYNIGLFDWETGALPSQWVNACNGMDEIWVPCHWTADVCRHSGVTKPIHVFGHCASPEDYAGVGKTRFPGIAPDVWKFYSIFQWTERKAPETLLRSYLTEFTARDRVALVLKTYGVDYGDAERLEVSERIRKLTAKIGGSDAPAVYVMLDMLSKTDLLELHASCDCFVLFHRAEGWGLPHFEASMMGKPVITTGYSSIMEFMKPEHSYLAGYKLVPITGMEWFSWYTPSMTWADPDVDECRKLMRHVFQHQAEARRKGQMAQTFVQARFTWPVMGRRMKARLEEIHSALP